MIPDIIVNGINVTVREIRDNDKNDVRMNKVRDIRDINNGNIEVREIADNRIWLRQQPDAIPQNVPVTTRIGTPIVNMPGCVKAHKDNQYHKSGLPVDKNLVEQDPDKAMILCDAQVPSYDCLLYTSDAADE